MISENIRDRVLKLKANGHGIHWIARHMNISRNSVRKILSTNAQQETEAPKEKRASLLDPYRKKIEELIEKDELEREKTRRKKPISTKWILKVIRKAGYKGGRTILDEYIRELRGPSRRNRKPFARFETSIAEEAQQDWSPYRVMIAGKQVVIQLFSLILCWSRYQFLRAFLDLKQPSLLYGHVDAFKYFQGVPWSIAYDRQSTITPCEVAGEPIIHDKFRQFSEHYGFQIVICKTKERKGKVEKPFLDFENSFLPLRAFESLEDFNRKLLKWLDGEEVPDEGNHRKHGTTGEVPYERWLEEKKYLYELPQTDLLPRRVEERTVNKDCTVSIGNCLYTVPAHLVEKGVRRVWVSIGPEDILIYDKKGELVAQHRLAEGKGRLVINEDHYKEIKRRKAALSRPAIERKFLERFPHSGEFLEGLKRTMRSIAPIHLKEILALARRHRPEYVEAAFKEALAHGTTTAGYVRQILMRNHPTSQLGDMHKEPPKGLSIGPVHPGDTAGYEGIFGKQDEQEERSNTDERDQNSNT